MFQFNMSSGSFSALGDGNRPSVLNDDQMLGASVPDMGIELNRGENQCIYEQINAGRGVK